MTFVKTHQPRRIDQIIDYFGERHRAASSDTRLHGRASTDVRTPRQREGASERVMAPHAFFAGV